MPGDPFIHRVGFDHIVDDVREARAANDPWTPCGALEANRTIVQALLRASVRVLFAPDHAPEMEIISGSFNYTGPANRLNDENIVVLGDAGVLNKEARAGQATLGRAAAAEIRRLIKAYGTAPGAATDALDEAS
jgi:hypothetical protein